MSLTFETKRRLESSRKGLCFSLMHLNLIEAVDFSGLGIAHTEIWPVRYCVLGEFGANGSLRLACPLQDELGLPVSSVSSPYQCWGPSRSPFSVNSCEI